MEIKTSFQNNGWRLLLGKMTECCGEGKPPLGRQGEDKRGEKEGEEETEARETDDKETN